MIDRLLIAEALDLIIADPVALRGRWEWLVDRVRAWRWICEQARRGIVTVYGDTDGGARAIPPGYFASEEPFDRDLGIMWVWPPRQLPDTFAKPDPFAAPGARYASEGNIITGLLVDAASLHTALARGAPVGSASQATADDVKANTRDERKLERWLTGIMAASPKIKAASKETLKVRWKDEGGRITGRGFDRAWGKATQQFPVWSSAGRVRKSPR